MRSVIFSCLAAAAFCAASSAHAQRPGGARAEITAGYELDGDWSSDDGAGGVRIGGTVGYDLPVSKHWILGIEAGAGQTLDTEVTSGPYHFVQGVSRIRGERRAEFDLSVRAGARVAPKTLLFGKLGVVQQRWKSELIDLPGDTLDRGHDSDLRVGAGIEQDLGGRSYFKSEYRYTDSFTGRHQILAGLGVRF